MVDTEAGRKLRTGALIEPFELVTVTEKQLLVPRSGKLIHLQFRRFAGCPVCNFHLRTLARRRDEIAEAGIEEVVVFHSTAELLRAHVEEVPFDIVADPEKRLYAAFGVEQGVRSLLNPRALLPIARSLARSTATYLRGRPLPSPWPAGGRYGLPADFLLAGDGRVVACKYGRYVYDQWSADELLDHARSTAPASHDGDAELGRIDDRS